MATTDAYRLLAEELASYRELTYEELVQLVGPSQLRRVRASDAVEYAIQVTLRWREIDGGDIVVDGWVAVDDCGPMRRLDDQFVVPHPNSKQTTTQA